MVGLSGEVMCAGDDPIAQLFGDLSEDCPAAHAGSASGHETRAPIPILSATVRRHRKEDVHHAGTVGKSAIISGSGRGIGRALALKLASEGVCVVVNDLDEDQAAEVVEQIGAAGGRAVVYAGNVMAPDFGDRFVQTALKTFGRLDIIVNNAGYTHDGVVQNQTDAQFQSMLDVRVVAPFRIRRAAAEPIRIFSKREAAEGRGRPQGRQRFLLVRDQRRLGLGQLCVGQGGACGHGQNPGERVGAIASA